MYTKPINLSVSYNMLEQSIFMMSLASKRRKKYLSGTQGFDFGVSELPPSLLLLLPPLLLLLLLLTVCLLFRGLPGPFCRHNASSSG